MNPPKPFDVNAMPPSTLTPVNTVEDTPPNQTLKMASNTATPDPRWPSKFRWLMGTPPPETLPSLAKLSSPEKTSTVPIAEDDSPPPSSTTSSAKQQSLLTIPPSSPPPALIDSSNGSLIEANSLNVPSSSMAPSPRVPVVPMKQAAEASQPGESNIIDSPPLPTAEGMVSSPPLTIAAEIPTSSLLLGKDAWSIPINIASKENMQSPSVDVPKSKVDLFNQENWPTLKDSQNGALKKREGSVGVKGKSLKEATQVSIPQDKRKEDNVRFPWAAKVDPAARNLYRAAEPLFLDDGTPKVIIPKHVLLQGVENQRDYILGQFFRCVPPPGGLIHAVLNKIWGRKCTISIKKLEDSKYLFYIPDADTRRWVLQRRLWHVDDCLMFVAPWVQQTSLAIPEIRTVPIWVTLKNIPNILYSISGISHIASGLGAPIATHKPRLDPFFMGEAKILVEVELCKAFPPRIAASDETGFIAMVDVEYAWLPSTCGRCGQLGHKEKRLEPAKVNGTVMDNSLDPIDDTATVSANQSPIKTASTISTKEKNFENIVSPSNMATTATLSTPTTNKENSVVQNPSISQTGRIRRSASTNDLVLAGSLTHLQEVITAPCTKKDITLPLLAAANAQTQSLIMGKVPSQVTLEGSVSSEREESMGVYTPIPQNHQNFALDSLNAGSLGRNDGNDVEEETSSYLTRGDRSIKPTQKIQDMGWKKVGGRGRGRRGRGNKNH